MVDGLTEIRRFVLSRHATIRRIFRRMNNGFLVLGLSLACCCLIAAPASAQTARRVSELRQEYFRLRNNDTGKGLVREWSNLLQQFTAVIKSAPEGSSELAIVLLDSAYIEYRLWRSGEGDLHAERAAQHLDRVLDLYPGFSLLDEVLRLRGDIAASFDRDFSAARRYYKGMQSAEDLKASRTLSLINDTFEKFAPAPELPVPDLIPSSFRRLGRKSKLIVLDPGHGGEDSGAVHSDLKEKAITLVIAKELEQKLVELGYRVHLTRPADYFLPLVRRTEKANDLRADVFVSLHVNSSPRGDGAGIESYYLDNTDDQSARRLAERENLSGGISGGGDDLGLMLSDLIQTGKLGDSIRLASTLQGDLVDALDPKWGPITNLGVKKAPFYVLVGAHMPCSLVEILFINHPDDARRLSEPRFRKDAAAALASGIESYFNREAVSKSGHKRIAQRSTARRVAKANNKAVTSKTSKKRKK